MDLHRRAIRIVHARLGLVSNNRDLLTRSEYFTDRVPQSLLTDYHRVDDVPWDGAPSGVDAEIRIVDAPGLAPAIALEPDRVLAVGDWTALEAANSDRRYSLFGNLGFVFRYVIHALERHHDTWSFHASAMVDDKGDLWLIPGGAGAGKTVFLLEGLARGWTIFSTEMTHVRLTAGGYEFYKGSLFDNIRLGHAPLRLSRRPGTAGDGAAAVEGSVGLEDRPRPSARADAVGRAGEPIPPHRQPEGRVRPGPRGRHAARPPGEAGQAPLRQRHREARRHRPPLRPAAGPVARHASADGPAAPRHAGAGRTGPTIKSARSTLCGARNCMEGLLDE